MRGSWRSCCALQPHLSGVPRRARGAKAKELGRSYLTLTCRCQPSHDLIKALYRSWAIPCSGTTVYAPRYRAEELAKIPQPGVRLRAERFYQQLDLLQPVRISAWDLLSESRKHSAVKLLRQIPAIGPIRWPC